MTKNLKMIMIGIMVILLASPLMAMMKEGKKHKCWAKSEKSEYCNKALIDKLNLSDKQLEEFNKLADTYKTEKEADQKEMLKMKEEMHKLMIAEKTDKEAIYKLIDEMTKLRSDHQKKCVDYKLSARALLTPEQIKIWDLHKGHCRNGKKEHTKRTMHNKHRSSEEGCK